MFDVDATDVGFEINVVGFLALRGDNEISMRKQTCQDNGVGFITEFE
jgi:hypothetical protein